MDENSVSGGNPDDLPLTDDALRLLAEAGTESDRLRHPFIGTEHVVLALLRDSHSAAGAVLARLGVDPDEARHTFATMITPGKENPPPVSERPYTTRTKKAFSFAADFARELGHARIGPEHVLVGLMREKMNAGAQILYHHGVTEESASAAIRRIGDDGSA